MRPGCLGLTFTGVIGRIEPDAVTITITSWRVTMAVWESRFCRRWLLRDCCHKKIQPPTTPTSTSPTVQARGPSRKPGLLGSGTDTLGGEIRGHEIRGHEIRGYEIRGYEIRGHEIRCWRIQFSRLASCFSHAPSLLTHASHSRQGRHSVNLAQYSD